jgi:hypothetical protein
MVAGPLVSGCVLCSSLEGVLSKINVAHRRSPHPQRANMREMNEWREQIDDTRLNVNVTDVSSGAKSSTVGSRMRTSTIDCCQATVGAVECQHTQILFS